MTRMDFCEWWPNLALDVAEFWLLVNGKGQARWHDTEQVLLSVAPDLMC